MHAETTAARVRLRVAGLVFLIVLSLLVTLSVMIYRKTFTDAAMVTLMTSRVGHQMHIGADVKVYGTVVGEVREISATGGGARMSLALKPDDVPQIPADVTAYLLPTTVFGKRHVELIPSPGATAAARALREGDVISEDRSKNSIELQEVLSNVLPLLTEVKPAKLAATLNAMARALDGRGTQFGKNLVQLDKYLKKLNPHLPALNRNIIELGKFSDNYADAAPDLIDALLNFTVTSRTVNDQRKNLTDLYSTVRDGSEDLDTFLKDNDDNLIRLGSASRKSLEVMAKYSPQFPCLFRNLAETVPLMDRALGKGTGKPGVHIQVESVKRDASARYKPGVDKPVYKAKGGPHCYPTPYGSKGQATAVPDKVKVPIANDGAALGLPNSPQENVLVNELLAPAMESVPEELPDWSTVLIGPALRGTKVEVSAR